MPRPPELGEARTDGSSPADLALIERVLDAQPAQVLDRLVVVEITPDEVAVAGFGADEHTEFEIGSVAKPMTTALFAIAVERGEVTPETPLGDLLELGDAPAADVTLEELASHRSGLPSTPGGPGAFLGQLRYVLRGDNPYPTDPDAALATARSSSLETRGTVVYSNLGVSLLGQALAEAAGTTYPELLEERLTGPLSLDATHVPLTPDGLDGDAPTGWNQNGDPADPWTLGSFAPAGGIRSTAADLSTWVGAILEEEAPGLEALEPRFDAGEELGRIGWAWYTTDIDGTEVTWHNGITGGFATIVALDRTAGARGDRAVEHLGARRSSWASCC